MQRGSAHILLGGILFGSSRGTSFISFKKKIHNVVTEANKLSDASAMGTPLCKPTQRKKSKASGLH